MRTKFLSLHIVSELGTNVVVGLEDSLSWTSPTMEATPDKFCVTGKIVASQHLHFDGKTIEGATLIFADGQIVECYAQTNEDTLRDLLEANAQSIAKLALTADDDPNSSSFTLGNTIVVFGTLDTTVTATDAIGYEKLIMQYGEFCLAS